MLADYLQPDQDQASLEGSVSMVTSAKVVETALTGHQAASHKGRFTYTDCEFQTISGRAARSKQETQAFMCPVHPRVSV